VAFSPFSLFNRFPPGSLVWLMSGKYAVYLLLLIIPVLVVALFLYVPVMIFGARFQTLVYELGIPPAGVEAVPDTPGPQIS